MITILLATAYGAGLVPALCLALVLIGMRANPTKAFAAAFAWPAVLVYGVGSAIVARLRGTR